jgi:hypothetical protein
MENSCYKPGDIVMVFGNPVKCTNPIDMARLVKFIGNHSSILEEWMVEYLDDEGHLYDALIKKTKNGEDKNLDK